MTEGTSPCSGGTDHPFPYNVVVHARSRYSDQRLLRIWINFDNGRVFPPYFARTRGGFVVR